MPRAKKKPQQKGVPFTTFPDGREGFTRRQVEDDPVCAGFLQRWPQCFTQATEHDGVIFHSLRFIHAFEEIAYAEG